MAASETTVDIAEPEKVSREQALRRLVTCWEALGHRPTVREYQRWSSTQRKAPGFRTIYRRFGSWTAACQAAQRHAETTGPATAS